MCLLGFQNLFGSVMILNFGFPSCTQTAIVAILATLHLTFKICRMVFIPFLICLLLMYADC